MASSTVIERTMNFFGSSRPDADETVEAIRFAGFGLSSLAGIKNECPTSIVSNPYTVEPRPPRRAAGSGMPVANVILGRLPLPAGGAAPAGGIGTPGAGPVAPGVGVPHPAGACAGCAVVFPAA